MLESIPAARRVPPLARALAQLKLLGVPAASVAAEAGISPAHLSEVASGTARPSPATAERIAAAIGQPVTDIFPDPLDEGGTS